MDLKKILIVLGSTAIGLGLICVYVVFYGNTGTYIVSSNGDSNTVFSTSTTILASSTPSSTLALGSSTASSTASSSSPTPPPSSPQAGFSSDYTNPPITWKQGNETMAITNGTLSGSQLTLDLQITMGSVGECVPLDIEVVTDENGDLAPAATPHFTFPDTGTCTGTPGETYSDQQVVFSVNPSSLPIIMTTGGSSNILFEVDTTAMGGLIIAPPPTTD